MAVINVCIVRLQAVTQMEEKLKSFIEHNEKIDHSELECDGAARFVHHQIIELARDCLRKSVDKVLSANYFYELNENLERLLIDVSVFDYANVVLITWKRIIFGFQHGK